MSSKIKLTDIIGVETDGQLFIDDEDRVEDYAVPTMVRDINLLPTGETVDTMTEKTVVKLINLVDEAVADYVELSPIYQHAAKELLKQITSPDQLKHMEFGEAMKLIEMATKYQLQPVEQLTKLVSTLQSLHEKNNIKNEIEKIKETAAKFEALSNQANKEEIEVEPTEADIASFTELNNLVK